MKQELEISNLSLRSLRVRMLALLRWDDASSASLYSVVEYFASVSMSILRLPRSFELLSFLIKFIFM